MKITLRALGKKVTLITSAFVLAVSSLLALVPFVLSERVAAASGTIVTNSLTTWDLTNTSTDGSGHNQITSDGLHVWTDASGHRKAAGYYNVADYSLSTETATTASAITFAPGGTGTAPSAQLEIDLDGNGTVDGYIVGEKIYAGDTWWLSPYASTGIARYSDGSCTPVAPLVSSNGYCNTGTLAQFATAFPLAKVTRIGYSLGSGVSGNYTITKITLNDTDFTFAPPAPTALPTRPSLSGTVIYDAISPVLPANYPSLGYAATSTSALGDKISFASTERNLDKVAVTLSSWACENGQGWDTGNCVSTPGSTFSHPVTLNIYNVAGDGTVGSLVGSKTQTFDIPYRPTADPTCADTNRWRDTNGDCQTGYNYVAVFDASGITVPNAIIYSISYNTSNYGTNPIGSTGPYDSLNVGLNNEASAPYVGTDVVPGELFWDSTYLGRAAGLSIDGGWGTYNIAATFTAVKPTVPTLISPANNAVQNVNDFYFTWSNTGAAEYEFQSSQNPATDPTTGALTSGVWNNKLNGGPDRNYLTTPQIHSYGANGTWYWQVRAIDSNGIKSDWSTVWKMTIDMVAPAAPTNLSWKTTTNVVVPDGGTTNVYGGTASWQASSSSDVDHYVYKYWNNIVGNQYKVGDEYIVPTSATSLPGVFNQGEGVHHFCVAAVDTAGNTSACTQFTITYDKTAPVISSIVYNASPSGIQVFTNGYTNEKNFVFHLAADADTTRYQLKYWNDISGSPFKIGSPWNPTNLNSTGHMATLGQYTDNFTQGEGVHYFSFSACDAAGNCSAYSDPFVVTYDKTAPVVTVNPIASSTDTTRTITGTVADDNTVTGVEVSIDGGTTWQSTTTFDGTNWTFEATGLAVTAHTVVARATDEAGNTSSADISVPASHWTTFAVQVPEVAPPANQGDRSTTLTPVPPAAIVTPQDTTPDTADIATDDEAEGNVSAQGETDGNNEVSMLGEQDSQKSWSLVNALLTAGIVLGSIIALVGAFGKKDEGAKKKSPVVGLLTLIPAIGAVILFFVTEDLSAKMIWLNTWTILVVIIAVLQMALVAKARDNE